MRWLRDGILVHGQDLHHHRVHVVHCFPTAMDLLLVFRRASVQELLGLYAK